MKAYIYAHIRVERKRALRRAGLGYLVPVVAELYPTSWETWDNLEEKDRTLSRLAGFKLQLPPTHKSTYEHYRLPQYSAYAAQFWR